MSLPSSLYLGRTGPKSSIDIRGGGTEYHILIIQIDCRLRKILLEMNAFIGLSFLQEDFVFAPIIKMSTAKATLAGLFVDIIAPTRKTHPLHVGRRYAVCHTQTIKMCGLKRQN